jgi:hypothetical protein
MNNYYIPTPQKYIVQSQTSMLEKAVSDDPVELLTAQNIDLAKAKIDLFTSLVEQRKEIHGRNMYGLQQDELFCRNKISEFNAVGDYDSARRIALTHLLRLHSEKRQEEDSVFRDTSRINKYLIESIMEYRSAAQKGEMLEQL